MRYFIRSKEWTEVTKEEYVAAERSQGFHNRSGHPGEPATSAFGGVTMEGRMEYDNGNYLEVQETWTTQFGLPRTERSITHR